MIRFLCSPTLTSIHDYWKNCSLTRWTFVSKVISLLFNMLSRLVITFLPRSKSLLISWLQSRSTMILEPKKIKSAYVSIVFPSIVCHEVMGPDAMILLYWMLSFKPAFSLSFFTFIKKLFSSTLPATKKKRKRSCSVMSYSLQPHGLYSPSGSSVHGILQASILEWIACPPYEIFSTLELNPHLLCLLHWQADSLPLNI